MKKLTVSGLMLLTITLTIQTANAKEWKDSFIQPIDNEIRGALRWENTQLADDLSDFTMWGLALAPTAVCLDQAEDRWQKCFSVWAAQGVSAGVTHVAKEFFGRTRPNKGDNKSFFSGHTSASFVSAASICGLERHYCAPGFALATLVGYLRIAADKHWFSDTLTGAIIGTASGQFIPGVVLEY